jgi:hypothetical protein
MRRECQFDIGNRPTSHQSNRKAVLTTRFAVYAGKQNGHAEYMDDHGGAAEGGEAQPEKGAEEIAVRGLFSQK